MNILFIAPIDKFSLQDAGYGTAAAGIAHVLNKMEQEKRIEQVLFFNTQDVRKENIPKDKIDIAIAVIHPNTFFGDVPGIDIIIKSIEKADKKLLSIVWETTPLPSKWKDLLNSTLFDGFITPSYFVGNEVKKLTEKPVYYFPHYIHTDDIPKVNIDDKKNEKWFTVLFIGQNTKRKGMEDSIAAFTRALGDKNDARLVLKNHRLSDREMNPTQMIFQTVRTNTIQPHARVYEITEMLDRNKMYGLYYISSVLLFISRGEGFGLPLAEGMSAGIPVIYTAWSSMPEVAKADGNIPIKYFLDESTGMFHYGYEIGSKYAIPVISDCMAALTQKYNLWKEDKREYYSIVQKNREVIIDKFGYDTVSNCIEHFINFREGFAPEDICNKMSGLESFIDKYNIVNQYKEAG